MGIQIKDKMSRKIKVLILTHMFPTKFNPIAGIFLLNQLKELKKYCDIKVIFPHAYVPMIKTFNPYYRFSKIPAYEKIEKIPIYHPKYFMIPRILSGAKLLHIYLTIEGLFSYLASKKLAHGIVKEWNPDIIHIHGTVSESLLGVNLKKKYKKPLLMTVYGEDITRYTKQIPSKYLTGLSLKNADAIICQSKFLENEIRKTGISNKKFFIIPMGVNTKNFSPKDKNKARQASNLLKNKKIILFVGHLVTRKGLEYLIRAIKRVLKNDKNILCCIIGKGPLEEHLKKLTSDLGLNDYIRFLGTKTNKEVIPYMNACDIFVLPSLNEGLPVVLCEALACGKPVVATKVAGTPELVNNDVGYLVNPKDVNDLAEKILLALNKKWKKEKILKRAQEFSVKNSVRKLMKIYRSFLVK